MYDAALQLNSQCIDLLDAAWKLGSTIPHALSVRLDTSASRNVLAATMADIMEAIRQAKPLHPPQQRDEWQRLRDAGEGASRSAARWRRGVGGVAAALRLQEQLSRGPVQQDQAGVP